MAIESTLGMPVQRLWKQTLSVAALFWGACLVLVALEARFGSNAVSAGLFFLSIPLLVAALTWAGKDIVFRRKPPYRFSSVLVLAGTVLASSTVIILVGLVAAAHLKTLMVSV